MKSTNINIILALLVLITSCSKNEPQTSSFLEITIDGSSHTFIGASIYEPVEWFVKDTIYNTTYFGGNIGDCSDGNEAFIDVRISKSGVGSFSLEDGISFWMQFQDFSLEVDEKKLDKHELEITIEEY